MLKRAWLEKHRSNTVVVPALLVLGGLQTLAETIGTSTAKPVLNLKLWHRGNKKSRCLKRWGGQGGPTNSRPISQPYQETASTGTNIADQIPRLFGKTSHDSQTRTADTHGFNRSLVDDSVNATNATFLCLTPRLWLSWP